MIGVGISEGATLVTAGESFDPQTDPIVRIEAGHLRRALERYYLTSGQGPRDRRWPNCEAGVAIPWIVRAPSDVMLSPRRVIFITEGARR